MCQHLIYNLKDNLRTKARPSVTIKMPRREGVSLSGEVVQRHELSDSSDGDNSECGDIYHIVVIDKLTFRSFLTRFYLIRDDESEEMTEGEADLSSTRIGVC